jgi:Uma2 family endonuclease
MLASTAPLSPDEYLSDTYDPEWEYVDGELIERNIGESYHSALLGIIGASLHKQRAEPGMRLFSSLRFQVAATRYRIPDICVTTQKARGRILRELLCIEVLSPEDRASRMELKIDDYLAFGVKHIWLIDPRRKKAWSYTSEGKRESSATLTTSEPRLTLNLDEVFATLDDYIEA